MPDTVTTKCCGTVTRCPDGECVLQYVFGGGGRCIVCKWVWDMMPGVKATPITVEDMKRAHE
jgi:hypothetical protein